ncbi:MAG: hypothetical protein KJ822_19745 [Proteobacteria bacterium]|jgi:hypothetical protein|nr:hypothetical protein [Pseudomonadota bacterium]
MSQLEIDKWAQGKPPLLAILSQHSASFADDLHEILSYAIKQEHIPKFPEADPKQWLRLYRNHRHLEKSALTSLQELGGNFGTFIAVFYSGIQSLRKTQTLTEKQAPKAPDPEQQTKAQAIWQEAYKVSLADLEADLRNHHIHTQGLKEKAKELCLNQEFLFIFKVLLPCLLLYNTTPLKLLRQARLGNRNAIEKLVRLDKVTLADHGVMRQTQRLLHRNKHKHESVVAVPYRDAPKFELSRKTTIYLLAGLISQMAKELNHKLTAPQIRALFDAIAYDRSNGEQIIDSDLPPSPEAFYKAIQRYRSLFANLSPTRT